MTPKEHAMMVSELLNEQSFLTSSVSANNDEEHFDICPTIDERNLLNSER